MTYPNPLSLNIKGLKNWKTDDGGGYQFTLTRHERPIAFVHQGGFGGPLEISWKDERSKKEITAFVETLPEEERYGLKMKPSLDVYLEDIYLQADIEKRFAAALARGRKKGILFTLPGDERYSFRTLKTLDSKAGEEWLVKKYGVGKFTIL